MKATRPLTLSDQTEVLRINALGLPGVAALDAAELRRLMALPNRHLAIEDESHAVTGYILAFPDSAPYDGEEFQALRQALSKPFVYIDQIVVQPSARRAHLGTALYEALEREARVEGMIALCCEVNLDPPNPGSITFHRRIGFETKGELRTADGRTVALLSKLLTSSTGGESRA